jgi:shikimate dehydrogenase
MYKLGLIGKKLGHSFSKRYFENLFQERDIHGSFDLIELEEINAFEAIKKQDYKGLSVTIPYKETIISYLDELDESAAAIGAVNCIHCLENGKLRGYNTDLIGFEQSLIPLISERTDIKKALVLGTGGASKAVGQVLKKLSIDFVIVSRDKAKGQLSYSEISQEILEDHFLIINCTPLGMFPEVDAAPEIAYESLTKQHLLYDLVYNPEETLFLKKGKERGATIKNGLEMLYLQAEAAWKIWNS